MIYKVKIDSECYADDLLCHSKYFKDKDNAKDYLDKTLAAITKKYEIASEKRCKEYGISMPYAYRDKPKHYLDAIIEVEAMINYRLLGTKYEDRIYEQRVFITLEPVKLEDE